MQALTAHVRKLRLRTFMVGVVENFNCFADGNFATIVAELTTFFLKGRGVARQLHVTAVFGGNPTIPYETKVLQQP